MSEQTTAVIEAVTSKEGATNGKAWRKFSVKTEDGTYYSTFDKEVAEQAHKLAGLRADILWKASGNEGQFKDLLSVRASQNGGMTTSPIPTEAPAARPDADGLRITRVALWKSYLEAATQWTPDVKPDAIYQFGRTLVTMIERDIYYRAPASADEDIPF